MPDIEEFNEVDVRLRNAKSCSHRQIISGVARKRCSGRLYSETKDQLAGYFLIDVFLIDVFLIDVFLIDVFLIDVVEFNRSIACLEC